MRLGAAWAWVLLAFATAAVAEPLPWHAAGWAQRAVVKVDASGSAGVDVAAVRILHAGDAAATGNDYRIFDAAGQPAPYEITFHDPARETLISFRAPTPGAIFAIYYGKPDAPIDPQRARVGPPPADSPPQPGPAANGWIPRAGLVLTTMRRPHEAPNPQSVAEMTALIRASKELDGAGYHPNISDGFNPFGDSDYYISIYRGWIRIPSSGTYGFCTASNEASFTFLDGKELVHWPGRHTEDRGRYGQKHVERPTEAGLHYVEYLHEEVLLYQVAFLGYKPPGAGAYVGIPNSLFPQPHRAVVQRYESADGRRLLAPRVELLDSRWPPGRAEGQHTRYRLAAEAGAEPMDLSAWTIAWSFGDGQRATGPAVEHVYLKLGGEALTMTAIGPQEQKIERHWPLTVFQIDHLAGDFRGGRVADYAALVKTYDPSKLTTPALVEMARFQDEASDRDAARQTALLATARPDIAAEDLADMHLLAATAAALGRSPIEGSSTTAAAAREVAEHLKIAVEKEPEPVQRVRILARFIRAVGIDQADVQTAEKLYAQAEQEAKNSALGRKMKAALREAMIACGDAHLYARQIDKANEDYRTAEALAEAPIPPQVRASKVGAFPEAIEQLIQAHRIEQAMVVAKRWQDEVPSDQIRGAVLFYIGKLERLQTRPAAAIRPLQLAIDLAQGAEFEAEARWILAQAYRDLGDEEACKRTLSGLIKSGLPGPFRQQALEALGSKPATKGAER